MKTKKTDLQKLFEDQLADIYYAEQHIVKALPKMAKAAASPELRTAFEDHLEESTVHVTRIEETFKSLGLKPKTKKCEAILGLLKEADSISEEFEDTMGTDAALICAAQKVEHYEMATYSSLIAWAEQLGHKQALKLLTATLNEEEAASDLLTEVAEEQANATADSEDEEDLVEAN